MAAMLHFMFANSTFLLFGNNVNVNVSSQHRATGGPAPVLVIPDLQTERDVRSSCFYGADGSDLDILNVLSRR